MKELLFKQFVPFLTCSMYKVTGNSFDNISLTVRVRSARFKILKYLLGTERNDNRFNPAYFY